MAESGQITGQNFYCKLLIKDLEYNPSNLNYLIIREWVFSVLPTVEIQFVDEGYLSETSPLEDGEDIQILIAKDEDSEEIIEMTFTLMDYDFGIIADNRRSIVTLTGHLKVSDFFLNRNRSFSQQASTNVLEQIATESGLTFSNPLSIVSDDTMTWFQANQSNFQFIQHVLKHSYLADDVIFFYGNTQNEFVVTALKPEIDKSVNYKVKYSVEKTENNYEDENEPDTIWYAGYDIVNRLGYYNRKLGYGFKYEYYNLTDKIDETYNTVSKMTELIYRNQDYITSPTTPMKYRYGGDFIENNVYDEKFFESKLRNKFLRENFFGMSLVLNVNAISTVKLFDKIDLVMPSLFIETESNEVYSGEYLVGGIQHELTKNGAYKKKISVHRNGINKAETLDTYFLES